MSSSTDKNRDPTTDFYSTPPWCVKALYHTVPWLPCPTLDPCAGDGALMDGAMRGIEVNADRALLAGWATGGRVAQGDGLRASWAGEDVLMNPPFANLMEWILKGLAEARSVVCLMRQGVLCGGARAPFWRHNPPDLIAHMSNRAFADSADYVWVAWTGLDNYRRCMADELTRPVNMLQPMHPVDVQTVWLNREMAGVAVTKHAREAWAAWTERGYPTEAQSAQKTDAS